MTPPLMVVGIDPGLKGALVFKTKERTRCYPFSDLATAVLHLDQAVYDHTIYVYMEDVHGHPGMDVNSVSTFMRNVGHIEAALEFGTRLDIHPTKKHGITYVPPMRWKAAMGVVLGGGAKTRMKKVVAMKKAQALYPNRTDIDEENADAFLIAEYGWRNETHGEQSTRPRFV